MQRTEPWGRRTARRAIVGLALACLVLGGCASGPKATSEESAKETPAEESDPDGEKKEASASPTPPEGFSDAEVLKVVSTPGGHAVILADDKEKRVVPIFIGKSQAMAIELRLQRRRYSRPLTHDLLDKVVGKLGGDITKVHIDAIKSGVFVGTVYVHGTEETYQIDARSSDAIALAVGNQAPIFVHEAVFEKAGISREKFDRGGVQRPRPYGDRPKGQSPKENPPDDKSEESEGSERQPFY